MIIYLVWILMSQYCCLIQAQTFCEPAEAFLVEIRLKELAPQDGVTCTTVDALTGFYAMVPEVLLTPGVVIPANCTVQRLLSYNCRESINFLKIGKQSNKKSCKKHYSPSMGAQIEIQTLLLCNACQVTTTSSSVPYRGMIDSNNLIDQEQLAANLNVAGLSFSVKAFEQDVYEQTGSKGRRSGRGGFRSRYSSRGRGAYRKTGRRTGTNRSQSQFFCGNQFLSSYYAGSTVQCECPRECML